MNFQVLKLNLEKAEEPEIKLPISIGLSKKQDSSRKNKQTNIYFCFINYAKVFDCVDHFKLWEILKEMGLPDHLTCLLRNLYAGQEATVRTGHGTAGLPVHHQLPGFTQLMAIESVIPSNHLILCRALSLLPSIFASMSVFSWQNSISLCPASFCTPRPNLPFKNHFSSVQSLSHV